jgi:hypothetical protein
MEGTNMANDLVSQIMAYEDGQMSEDETIEFFQQLVNSGLAWQLQGSYGRMAKAMLDAGVIHLPTSASR